MSNEPRSGEALTWFLPLVHQREACVENVGKSRPEAHVPFPLLLDDHAQPLPKGGDPTPRTAETNRLVSRGRMKTCLNRSWGLSLPSATGTQGPTSGRLKKAEWS
jgi:hypothetical protein